MTDIARQNSENSDGKSRQVERLVIQPAFPRNQKVLIKELNVVGKVLAYYYRDGLEYNVRYFDNGNVREVYFYEDELQAV